MLKLRMCILNKLYLNAVKMCKNAKKTIDKQQNQIYTNVQDWYKKSNLEYICIKITV